MKQKTSAALFAVWSGVSGLLSYGALHTARNIHFKPECTVQGLKTDKCAESNRATLNEIVDSAHAGVAAGALSLGFGTAAILTFRKKPEDEREALLSEAPRAMIG